MRADIDLFLNEEHIDALWVMGAMKNNADMVYFTGIQEVKNADLFKLQESRPWFTMLQPWKGKKQQNQGLKRMPLIQNCH